jgi:hypothetical protein
MKYRHVQTGTASIIALGIGLVVMATVFASLKRMSFPLPLFAVVTLIFVVSLVVFGKLTTEVDGHEFRARFGLFGWPSKVAALEDIAGALPTRLSWLSGWGIRITTRGILFNVSGFGAVIIGLNNGKQFLIGTDEPKKLADAINASLGRAPIFTTIRGAGKIENPD